MTMNFELDEPVMLVETIRCVNYNREKTYCSRDRTNYAYMKPLEVATCRQVQSL